jgi:hypothetical protein
MPVYVDDMYKYPIGEFGRMKMSHMAADTTAELLAMVDKIGVARRWIQYPGTDREHFDIAVSKRALAVAAGAIETTMTSLCCVKWSQGPNSINLQNGVPSRMGPRQGRTDYEGWG